MPTEERTASRTAIAVALLRVVHQLCDAPPRILDDPIIPLLLDRALVERATNEPAYQSDLRALALRSNVVLRNRYAEDCLQRAAQRGMRQFVILGAGLDTFAYRQPEWANALRIFEVDHPASQRAKQERLRTSGLSLPGNLQYVAADFESMPLRDILMAGGVDFAAPAFFSCLGVLVYLPQAAIQAIFEVTASFPKGSEFVFTFSQGPSEDSPGFQSIADSAAAVGEPWQSYHQPDELRRELRAAGFSEISMLSPEQARELYFHDRTDGLRAPRRSFIARAVV